MSTERKKYLSTRLGLAIVLISLIASSCIVAAYADTTLFDNQGTGYWTVYNGGSGGLKATISTSTSVVHSGASSSLELSISPGASSVVGFYHVFSPTVDWSSYGSITFWLYGQNSGGYVYFVVFDKTDTYYLDILQDNFVGWKQFTLNFTTCFSSGTVDLSNIYAIEFAFGEPAPSTLYLDQMVLVTSSSPSASPSPSPAPSSSASPSQTPAPSGIVFFPPEPTPIVFPSVTPASATAKPTPVPGSPVNLNVYVVNGTTPVTDGVVTVGAASVSLNSSGIAFFSDLVASRLYDLTVVVNGVKVYDNTAFVVPASGAFTVNVASKSSAGPSSYVLSLVLIVIVIIAFITASLVVLLRRAKR